MTSILRHKALLQLGFCLLLITGFTLWSVSWHSPAFQEGEFKQLGDSSPSFLISVGDSSSSDEPFSAAPVPAPLRQAIVAAEVPVGLVDVVTRIRIASYPVLPQAPPLLT